MPWFVSRRLQPFFLCLLLHALVLETLAQTPEVVIQTTEAPCRSAADWVNCYQCKTNSHHADDYCGDPFNQTHPDLTTMQCKKAEDYCAKWVVQLQSGAVQTTRTCSNKLQLKMKIYTVCMTESGSNEGHLCFCEGDLCNAATSLYTLTSPWTRVTVCALLAFLVGGSAYGVSLTDYS